ncbi:hypothetical protein [Tianweitania sediminis]|uniref:Uncharacterized protein n=1 Tax=Tianweitania sediminis TaxID=1502156 RepID=A0A8J7UGR4_9HYPH|nr:hypothetical protein [Tianweitania sediminis]MBP0438454.1 hypothetical protein [Tianweitania sediminis]
MSDLKGDGRHLCRDWDYLEITRDSPEWDRCHCEGFGATYVEPAPEFPHHPGTVAYSDAVLEDAERRRALGRVVIALVVAFTFGRFILAPLAVAA